MSSFFRLVGFEAAAVGMPDFALTAPFIILDGFFSSCGLRLLERALCSSGSEPLLSTLSSIGAGGLVLPLCAFDLVPGPK